MYVSVCPHLTYFCPVLCCVWIASSCTPPGVPKGQDTVQQTFEAPIFRFVGCLCMLLDLHYSQCAVCSVIGFRHDHIHSQYKCIQFKGAQERSTFQVPRSAQYTDTCKILDETDENLNNVKKCQRREIFFLIPSAILDETEEKLDLLKTLSSRGAPPDMCHLQNSGPLIFRWNWGNLNSE